LGQHGITANSVAPGLIGTDITGERWRANARSSCSPGRLSRASATLHDVADIITYLCREESGYITGVTYDVNGGSHIH
jgi:NAD(P)-dependent dehydrogenase (short-subunit alcohol dehydrogenase family)